MRSGGRSSGGAPEQGCRIDQTHKREAADGPCVASMTSLNLLERMNELSDGRSARSMPRGRRDAGPYPKSRLTSFKHYESAWRTANTEYHPGERINACRPRSP